MRTTRSLFVSCLVLATVAACGSGNPDDFSDAECGDGKDNDGDGATDFPDDLGCTGESDETEDSLPMPACSDGRDNDGDGKRDYPADPGCYAPQQDDEADDCPSGPNCPQCADGQDNDGNGGADYPNDPGCTSASDDDEFLHNPVACGPGMLINPLPTTGTASGMLDASSTSMLASPCGGGGGLPSVAYELHLSKPQVVVISTDDPLTAADTVIDLRGDACSSPSAEIACNDNVTSTNTKSTVTASLAAGNYYIVITAKTFATLGAYVLSVKRFAGEGSPCTNQNECGPTLVCRIPQGASAMVCTNPMCNDGVDDDGRGDGADYPDDPGCADRLDNDETDDCPGGLSCPDCGDGADNDLDGMTDYPGDTTCLSAGDSSEACLTTDGVGLLTTPATTGDTSAATAHNDVRPVCASATGHTANDLTYRLDVPGLTSLNVNLTGSTFFAAIALFNSSCTGTALGCSLSDSLTTTNLAAGIYYVVVDGYSTGQGPFTLNVTGTIAAGQSCESALALAGALTCGPGFACKGSGSRTCQPALCNDGIDNDLPTDGKFDYPTDPGCSSPADDTEADTCPGAGCPVCANTTDQDGDGLIDWPNDYGCSAASGTSEVFCATEADATSLIITPTVTGTTAGKANNFTGAAAASCTSAEGPDVAYALSLPVTVQTLVIDAGLSSFDTVLTFRDAQCSTEIECDDDGSPVGLQSLMTLTNVTAGNYAIVLDGFGSSAGASGAYSINVRGTLAAGTSCASSLFTAGVLVCAAPTTCVSGTCQ